jgi:hypothetical protein
MLAENGHFDTVTGISRVNGHEEKNGAQSDASLGTPRSSY